MRNSASRRAWKRFVFIGGSFRVTNPSHSRMGPNGFVRPALPPWDTVGVRINEPVLSPPSSCLAAETEAAETQSAPDVSRGPLAAT
jgi:hypothetical protein